MARWFDDTAKSAARRDVAGSPPDGMTRRTVITRGAVVAGVAWTAPLLMQTRAYAGASACLTGTIVCTGTNGRQACCTSTQTCYVDSTGLPTCIPQGSPGGICTNEGVGVCTDPNGVKSNCNGHSNPPQCNACSKPHICGGEAAPCDGVTLLCAPGLTCAFSQNGGVAQTQKFCRKPCTTNAGCASGQICDTTNFCAQTCTAKSNCQGEEQCVADGTRTQLICSYV